MEENLKEKPKESEIPKSLPALKPGGPGITITPVSPPSSKPTTPLPKAPMAPPPFTLLPKAAPEEKRERVSFLLLLIIILNIFSLWLLITIGTGKIPGFLAKLF